MRYKKSSAMQRFECNLNIIRAHGELAYDLKGPSRGCNCNSPLPTPRDLSIRVSSPSLWHGYVKTHPRNLRLCISEIFIPVRLRVARLTDNRIRRCLYKIRGLPLATPVCFHYFVTRRWRMASLKCNCVQRKLVNILFSIFYVDRGTCNFFF